MTRRWQNPSNSSSAARPRSPSDTAQTCNSTICRPSALSKSIGRGGSRIRLGAPPGAGLVEQLFEDLIGLGADNPVALCHKGGDTGDAPLARFRPIGIDRTLEAAPGQDVVRLLCRKTDGLRDFDQDLGIADIARVDEISLVQGVVDRLAARLRIGPFAELLRQPAVVGIGSPAVGQ